MDVYLARGESLNALSRRDPLSLYVSYDGHQIACGAQWLYLAPTAWRIFIALAVNMGRVVLRADLIDAVYSDDPHGGPETAENCIKVVISRNLRKQLASVGLAIRIWWGIGYRLEACEASAPLASADRLAA